MKSPKKNGGMRGKAWLKWAAKVTRKLSILALATMILSASGTGPSKPIDNRRAKAAAAAAPLGDIRLLSNSETGYKSTGLLATLATTNYTSIEEAATNTTTTVAVDMEEREGSQDIEPMPCVKPDFLNECTTVCYPVDGKCIRKTAEKHECLCDRTKRVALIDQCNDKPPNDDLIGGGRHRSAKDVAVTSKNAQCEAICITGLKDINAKGECRSKKQHDHPTAAARSRGASETTPTTPPPPQECCCWNKKTESFVPHETAIAGKHGRSLCSLRTHKDGPIERCALACRRIGMQGECKERLCYCAERPDSAQIDNDMALGNNDVPMTSAEPEPKEKRVKIGKPGELVPLSKANEAFYESHRPMANQADAGDLRQRLNENYEKNPNPCVPKTVHGDHEHHHHDHPDKMCDGECPRGTSGECEDEEDIVRGDGQRMVGIRSTSPTGHKERNPVCICRDLRTDVKQPLRDALKDYLDQPLNKDRPAAIEQGMTGLQYTQQSTITGWGGHLAQMGSNQDTDRKNFLHPNQIPTADNAVNDVSMDSTYGLINGMAKMNLGENTAGHQPSDGQDTEMMDTSATNNGNGMYI